MTPYPESPHSLLPCSTDLTYVFSHSSERPNDLCPHPPSLFPFLPPLERRSRSLLSHQNISQKSDEYVRAPSNQVGWILGLLRLGLKTPKSLKNKGPHVTLTVSLVMHGIQTFFENNPVGMKNLGPQDETMSSIQGKEGEGSPTIRIILGGDSTT